MSHCQHGEALRILRHVCVRDMDQMFGCEVYGLNRSLADVSWFCSILAFWVIVFSFLDSCLLGSESNWDLFLMQLV